MTPLRFLTLPAAALAVLLAAAPRASAAEPADAGGKAAAEPDAEEPKGPKLVVVADARPTATANSQLRASLYDVAREAGYEAAGKVDVEEAASRASLMKAGVVTADDAELGALRRALDVAVLVRVSKDDAGRVRLSVVTKRGTQSRVLAAAEAAQEEPLQAALKDLLPPLYKAEKAGAAPVPASGDTAGSLAPADKKPDSTLVPREAWEARGGFRPTYGAMLLASATNLTHVAFRAKDGRTGEASATGVGGGVGVRVGLIYLPTPDPALGVGSFVAVRLGVGLDTNVLYTRKPNGYDAGGQVAYGSEALWVSGAPLYFGFAIAAGKFPNATSWRGALIGFGYAPAAQFQMDLKGTSGKFRFNPAGAEASVDITTLRTSEHADAEMQIRLAISGLVPLGDDRPGFLSLGIGAIWY